MAFLFQSPPKVIPEFTGLQINTAVQVLPIPIIYGGPRCNLNLVYYNGFHTKLVSAGGGGKGILSGGKGGAQQVEYFATLIMALGEGTITGIKIIYQDQGVYLPSNYPSNGAYFFEGTDTQAAWDYIVSNWPDDARVYKDDAYYGFADAQLDSSATVPQINVVPTGLLSGTSPLNNSTITITTGQYDPTTGNPISYIGSINLGTIDADPGQTIYDFLTNARYGAGFPSSWIDEQSLVTTSNGFIPGTGDAAVGTYCQAVGLAWSVVLNNVESANSILERWTRNLVVAPVWTGELLKFIPYWDKYADTNPNWDSANGVAKKYYQPNTTPIIQIISDHVLQANNQTDDPITFDRIDPLQVYNTVRVDYRDRTNFFNDNVEESKDEADIELIGPRVDNIGLANEFTLAAYAQASAQMLLRRHQAVRRKFRWRMGPLWAIWDPMDVLSIPDPKDWSATVTVRIISCTDDADEITTYEAEEFPIGAMSGTFFPTNPTTPPNQGPTNVVASAVFPPVIIEPTSAMLTATGFSSPQVIIGASGGTLGVLDTNWGGCYIWVSLDNNNYEQIGSLTNPSTIGLTSAYLPAYGGSNPDSTDTLTVNLSESDGSLTTVPPNAASNGSSLCVIKDASGFELLSYTTAALVSGYTYNLTGLYRGLYGTPARAFGSGSQFLFLGSSANYFETALPSQYVGQTFYVKLQSFNVFGSPGGTQTLSDCVVYEYIAQGDTYTATQIPPAPNRSSRVTGSRKSIYRRRRI